MDDKSETRDAIRNRRLEKLRFWRRACADESATLQTYNLDSSGNPLIFLHGDFEMGGFYVRRLAAECGYPIAALAPHGLQGEEILPSIEWMARERVQDILSFRPEGPYRLGGYCNGALVAYEAARLLRQMGHVVELVVMVEPASLNVQPLYRRLHGALSAFLPRPDKRPTATQQRFGLTMNTFWNIGRVAHLSFRETAHLARKLKPAVGAKRMDGTEAVSAGDPAEKGVKEKLAHFTRVYSAATASYLPAPTSTPIVVLSTGLDHGGRRCGLYEGVQWGRVASNFRHIQIPGHHLSCLSDYVEALAANLGAVLRAPPVTIVQPPARVERPKLQTARQM